MPNAGFVHLHVHSAYSLLKGSIKIAKLGELAKADKQPALALTDTDNMFGALEFSDKMASYGIQPIVGLELAVDFGDQDPNARNAHAAVPSRLVLLAARERGYRFDASKIIAPSALQPMNQSLAATHGQLDHEWQHLRAKLAVRSPQWLARWADLDLPELHPLFRLTTGPVAEWERV